MTIPRERPTGGSAISGFLTAIFVFSLIASSLVIAVRVSLLNPDAYTAMLNNESLAVEFQNLLADAVVQSTAQEGGAAVSPEMLRSLVLSVIPADWFQTESSRLVRAILDFVNLKSGTLDLTIDLTPIKQNLAAADFNQLATFYFGGLPECSADELTQIQTFFATGQSSQSAPVCRPPEPYLSQALALFSANFQQVGASIPASIPLVGPEETQAIKDSPAYTVLTIAQGVLSLIPLFSLGLILLIGLANIRQPFQILRHLGVGFTVGGFLFAVTTLLTRLMVSTIPVTMTSQPAENALSQKKKKAIVNIIGGIAGQFIWASFIIAGVAVLIGLLLLALHRLANRQVSPYLSSALPM